MFTPAAWFLKLLRKPSGASLIYPPDDLNTALLPQGRVGGNWRQLCPIQGQERGGEEPLTTWVQLQGQPRVKSSHWLLPTNPHAILCHSQWHHSPSAAQRTSLWYSAKFHPGSLPLLVLTSASALHGPRPGYHGSVALVLVMKLEAQLVISSNSLSKVLLLHLSTLITTTATLRFLKSPKYTLLSKTILCLLCLPCLPGIPPHIGFDLPC